MQDIKIIYQCNKIPSEKRYQYDLYTLIKSQTSSTSKPGFLQKKEVECIASQFGTTKRAYINKLNQLVDAGFITKNKYGYILTSTNTINNKLKLNTITNSTKDYTYSPYTKYPLPQTNDTKIIEVMRMYTLINQIYQRFNYRLNGNNTGKKISRPERFELSIDKIMIRGGYHTKMEVWRLINHLENVNLVNIKRGKSGAIDGVANQYTLLPFKNAVWSNLYKAKTMNRAERWNKIIGNVSIVNPVVASPKTVKKVTTYNSAELAFYECLKAGLQDILVDAGALSRNHKSFGSKKGRKVTKAQLPKLLAYVLNDESLKTILLTQIRIDQIQINTKEGNYYNRSLLVNCYDRDNYFVYDKPLLVAGNGNYNTNRTIRTQTDQFNQTKYRALITVRPEATCII